MSGCCSKIRCRKLYSITAIRHLHGYIISICVCWIQVQRIFERGKDTAIFETCKFFGDFFWFFVFANGRKSKAVRINFFLESAYITTRNISPSNSILSSFFDFWSSPNCTIIGGRLQNAPTEHTVKGILLYF